MRFATRLEEQSVKCAQTINNLLAPALIVLLTLGLSARVWADELSDAIAAAEKAADAAEKAAAKAMSTASAARAAGDADKAAAAAMDAGSAARDAAQAVRDLADRMKSASVASSEGPAASDEASSTAAATTTPTESTESAASSAVASGEAAYAEHVQCNGGVCQIDLFLTRGFRAFSQCQVCHGLDANGSSFAPSLNTTMQQIDKSRFVDVVTNGYKGQVGVMPPWKTNPNVMKYMDNLYAYLMARSDKVIPAGKLERYDR